MAQESVEDVLTHRELIEIAMQTLRHRYDLVATELSPYQQYIAFDFIALSRLNKEIRVIECKANRADFLADNKWRGYLPYCTHLAFFGSKQVFSKHELPREIGVIRPKFVVLRNGIQRWEWYYERGCRHLHDVGGIEYLRVLEGFLWKYMKCSWRCEKRGL